MANLNTTTTYSVGLKRFFVEYLRVTAKGHSFKEWEVEAGSKDEARAKCPYMTTTGRVRGENEVFSCLRVVANSVAKSDRGCRAF